MEWKTTNKTYRKRVNNQKIKIYKRNQKEQIFNK